jgi:hypothetical protein
MTLLLEQKISQYQCDSIKINGNCKDNDSSLNLILEDQRLV